MSEKTQDEKIAEQITDTWISKPSKQGLKQIAEAIQKARAEERERCAIVCTEQAKEWDSEDVITDKNYAGYCAQAIRNLK